MLHIRNLSKFAGNSLKYMIKKTITLLIYLIFSGIHVYGASSGIRINQFGYLPGASKKAIFISESETSIQQFTIHDALTNEVYSTLQSLYPWGSFDKFNSNIILDFSSFCKEGAFYIKAGDTYSPTIYINKNIYTNTSDKLIAYIRSQRFGGDVSGGWWYDSSNKNRSAAVNAAVTYQLLITYSLYPEVFSDLVDYYGNNQPNEIPDIIDEAKWGLDWLTKVNLNLMPVAVAGKISAVFALSSEVLEKFYPDKSEELLFKAIEVYHHVKKQDQFKNQQISLNAINSEENWKDDMQLAATQLYLLTYEQQYLQDALSFGAAEPVPQWIFSICDKPLQFYPYFNWSPFLFLQFENPHIKKNYKYNIETALQRAKLTANDNPFNIGVNLSENSNNKITALHNMCFTYRLQTGDTTFINMEESLFNWIFGCNPWGISMVTGIPDNGKTPQHPHSKTYIESDLIRTGALINGAIGSTCLKNTEVDKQVFEGKYEKYQTDWGVYRDHVNDFITNQANIDASSLLLHLMAARQKNGEKKEFTDKNQYNHGGINRFNPGEKQIAIIFTGHQYTDGYKKIRTTLNKHNIKASFFFSGDFLRKPANARKVKALYSDGHYIGPAGNHYNQLAKKTGAQFSSVSKSFLLNDLKENYAALKKLGISKQEAPFFNPPYELYNDSISKWSKDAGIYIISSTPGTKSNFDYTVPEMRTNYYSSKEITDNILQVESIQGLNGYILQFHFGSSQERKDKYYHNLSTLILNLKNAGYEFTDLFSATDLVSYPIVNQKTIKNKIKK